MALSNDLTRFICLFHSPERASAAAAALQKLNLGPNAIDTIGSGAGTGSEDLTTLGVPDRDLGHIREGLRKGGVLLSLEAPEDRSGEVERVFHHYSADKIDETEIETGVADVLPAAGLATAAVATPTERVDDIVGEAVIPVAQEELVVGKREVERGGVRVLRRIVDEPVQQDVTLHNERVVLDYREVNRPFTDADLRAGTQEIELIETAEVPVVQKTARVVEEVHVGKVESDRTEVVQDTVRHTEVEVEPLDTTGTRRFSQE